MTGAEAIVDRLADHGVELVFGIPGSHSVPFYEHFESAGIRHVTPRQEQTGGYAAYAYARTSGRPGVCIFTSGPGILNVATAAATAYHDSVPMVLISPGMPNHIEGTDAGFLHQVKAQSRALDNIVSWSRRVSTAAEARAALDEAYEDFETGRPRPVHIEVPLELLDAAADFGGSATPAPNRPPLPDPAALAEAAELLGSASRPVLLLGGGATGAAAEATALAEHWDAPVVTTVAGKGVVSERHPLSLGSSLRLPGAREVLCSADVVLAVGTEIAESDLWVERLQLDGRVVRIDIDPEQLQKNAPAAVAILSDAAPALGGLGVALAGRGRAEAGDGRERAARIRIELADQALHEGAPFSALNGALNGSLDKDATIVGDSTKAFYFGTVHGHVANVPGRLLYPTGFATLGFAVPAAIGAKLAVPDRQVVAISGDGGFMYTATDLITAVELGLSFPTIVVNDGGYGEIRDEMNERGIPPLGVDLMTPDLPALARSLGAYGRRVEDQGDLEAALAQALAAERPTLIEVPMAANGSGG